MSKKLIHFAIHTVDIVRVKNFYDGVFDGVSKSCQQGGFLIIRTAKSASGKLIGALQRGKYSPIPDKDIGLECSTRVERIDEIIEKVKSKCGQVVKPKTSILCGGCVTRFLDTEANLICGMQYNNTAR